MSARSAMHAQRRSFAPIWALILGLFVITSLAGCTLGDLAPKPAVPEGLQLVAEINLSERAYEAEELGQLELPAEADIMVNFSLRNLDTPYFDLAVVGPAGERYVITHGEQFRTGRDGGGTWERRLPAGTYRLVLTAAQSPGVLSVSWGYR